MSAKNETTVLVLSLLITTALAGSGFWWLTTKSKINLPVSTNNPSNSVSSSKETTGTNRMSLGENILIAAEETPDKKSGIQAFAKGYFSSAINYFQSSLKNNHNDPETLIYLNNAKAAQQKTLKIAVSVPIGGNLNVAKEMLRGVAQAQEEINRNGGINQALLQVQIANDDNDPFVAKQLASELVADKSILAVVGHNSSEASLAAAPVYQQGGLVMISPTSHAKRLSGIGSFIFRTIPSIRFDANILSRYAMGKAGLKNIAVCADSKTEASQLLKDEFTSNFFSDGGKISRTVCDFSAADFNPSSAVSQAVSDGADGLLLAGSIGNLNQAIAVAKANQGRLAILGNYTLYTSQTLKEGQGDVNDMVLAVPWHPGAIPGNSFADNAVKIWGGPVNWRTALAYDAAVAIISGLEEGNSREGLQKVLSRSDFSTNGATGIVQFLPSGDRNGASLLVKVVPGKISGTGYDFVPVEK